MAGLFSKIIKGEIPSFKIYEDEHVFAFLDIRPIHLGHTLVVPKVEVDHFFDVPEPYYSAVFQAAKRIGLAIQEVTGCPRVGTTILGFEVPHAHYHVVPLWGPADLSFSLAKARSPEEMKDIQAKIVQALRVDHRSS
jgi:histidine triad (HIT) family protein